MKVKIKAPRDFWAGLMFIGVGLFFMIWALAHYQMGTAVRMGPAYFPTVLGGLLAVLGAMVLVESFAMDPGGHAKLWLPFNRYDFGVAVAVLPLIKQYGVRAMVGKGGFLQDTVDAMSAGEQEEEPPAAEEEEQEDVAEDGVEEEPAEEAEPETRTYLVQPGDTLRGIANEVYGDPDQWEVIAEANGLTRETVLTVGQELVIPPPENGA